MARARHASWSVLLGALALGACAAGQRHLSTPRIERDRLSLARAQEPASFGQAINAFGLDVWEGLRTSGYDGNLAVSPAGIVTALCMLYAGARGTTATEIAQALYLSSTSDEAAEGAGALLHAWNDPARRNFTLAVVNRLYADRRYALHAEYVTLTRDAFGAEVQLLDFAKDPEGARSTINAWVKGQTHDRIAELMPDGSIQSATRAVIVSAIYFHGAWERPFDPKRTRDRTFYVRGADEADVPMMESYGGMYGEYDGVQLAELPYAGGELVMLLALPRIRDGLEAVEARLDGALVAEWRSRLGASHDMQLTMPRFRVETEAMALGPALRSLGVREAFTAAADFGGIAGPGGEALKLDEAYHQTFVEVDEKGTEAAAAVGFSVGLSQEVWAEPPPIFYADHPFLFFIVEHDTGAILFAGRVVDPR